MATAKATKKKPVRKAPARAATGTAGRSSTAVSANKAKAAPQNQVVLMLASVFATLSVIFAIMAYIITNSR